MHIEILNNKKISLSINKKLATTSMLPIASREESSFVYASNYFFKILFMNTNT